MTTAAHSDPLRMAWLALRRHRWLAASLAVHATLLGVLYYTGFYLPELDTQQRRVAASGRADSHDAMRRRVSDMERIKDLMRESLGETDAGAERAVRFDATTAAPDPADLLAQAEALARDIDALRSRARIEAPPPPAASAGAAQEAVSGKPPPQADGDDPAPAVRPGQKAQPTAQERGTASGAPATSSAATASSSASAAGSSAASGAGPATASAAAAGTPGAGGAGGAEAAGAGGRIAALEQYARGVLAQRQRQLEGGRQGSDASTHIGAFFKRAPDGREWAQGGYLFDSAIFQPGAGSMPSVDTASMRKGAARLLGAGGAFANRVYVNSWYVIGPFPGKHGDDLLKNGSYPPEQAVVLDAAYRGKDGRFLTWRYVNSPTYPLVPPDPQEDSVYYGYSELMMDADRELAVWIGADDDAQVWINDRLAWKGGNTNKRWFFEEIHVRGGDYAAAYNLNEDKVLVRFRKGRNKLFFKLSNGPTKTFFSMVLAQP